MKRLVYSIILLLYSGLMIQADTKVVFTITDAEGVATASSMENTMSAFLTELNSAFEENRTPDLSNLNISKRAQTSILSLWETSPFKCEESEIVQRLLHSEDDYSFREIPIIFPMLPDKDKYREISVAFDKSGQMTVFNDALERYQYKDVLKVSRNVKDKHQRILITQYIDHLRTAYNTKDLDFLNMVFSDDALIITGRVVKAKKSRGDSKMMSFDKIIYTQKNKAQYMRDLSALFKKNKWLNFQFDKISVLEHPTKENWYGVTLKQRCSLATGYKDEGWVFLLWDFTDPKTPVIHVRTWQPDKLNDKELREEEVFGFDDIKFN